MDASLPKALNIHVHRYYFTKRRTISKRVGRGAEPDESNQQHELGMKCIKTNKNIK